MYLVLFTCSSLEYALCLVFGKSLFSVWWVVLVRLILFAVGFALLCSCRNSKFSWCRTGSTLPRSPTMYLPASASRSLSVPSSWMLGLPMEMHVCAVRRMNKLFFYHQLFCGLLEGCVCGRERQHFVLEHAFGDIPPRQQRASSSNFSQPPGPFLFRLRSVCVQVP